MSIVNVVIPMAGMGSRFSEAGYAAPKPFIDVKGKLMIMRVLENLIIPSANYFLIARKEHIDSAPETVKYIQDNYNVTFISIDRVTEGTACTVLFAREFINNDNPLLIANSDQIVDININSFLLDATNRSLDGSILTFIDSECSAKWSFARLGEDSLVKEVREKVAISNIATVGIYLFDKGRNFVNSAIDMIIRNERVNNEFYTCPVYNYMINSGGRVGVYNIEESQMHGIGTPADLQEYLSLI